MEIVFPFPTAEVSVLSFPFPLFRKQKFYIVPNSWLTALCARTRVQGCYLRRRAVLCVLRFEKCFERTREIGDRFQRTAGKPKEVVIVFATKQRQNARFPI